MDDAVVLGCVFDACAPRVKPTQRRLGAASSSRKLTWRNAANDGPPIVLGYTPTLSRATRQTVGTAKQKPRAIKRSNWPCYIMLRSKLRRREDRPAAFNKNRIITHFNGQRKNSKFSRHAGRSSKPFQRKKSEPSQRQRTTTVRKNHLEKTSTTPFSSLREA